MACLRSSSLFFLVVLGCLAACGPDAVDAPDASAPEETPDASVPVTCDAIDAVRCGDSCVNIESDSTHCGACDQVCARGEECAGGVCVARCQIDEQSVASGAVNEANACEECNSTTSSTAWTQRADGTTCNPGQICAAGECRPQCLIGGVFHDAGTANPENECEHCLPETSTSEWSPKESVTLLVGGEDIAAQGWTTVAQTPNTLSYGDGYVSLTTSTIGGRRTGGQLLIQRANAFDPTQPFTLRLTMQVESANPHNAFDSGAAILGSFTPPYGSITDRAQMIYLDSAAIGWADDTMSAAFSVTDGAYHVYELAVDAAKVATLSIDGNARLTRNNFAANGTIAIGDQTNDENVDGSMRIKSVERLCL